MSLINVSALLSNPNFVRPFTRKRPTVTIANNGRETTTYAEVSAVGSIQPATDSDVADLPEGTRLMEPVVVYSTTELRPGGKGVQSDLVVVDGKTFRVIAGRDWSAHGFYQVIAVRNTP